MLCTIYGFADLAQNQFTSNKVLNNYLSKICKSTTYVSKLTSQLLSLSQRKKINFCELNLSIEIIQWLDMLKIAAGKNISLKVNAPPDIPEIIADQTSIEQLLMKLVINSRNIMPQGGELTISVKEVKEETENSNKNHIKGSSCISLSFTYSCPEIDNETFRQLSQPYITLISKNDRISRSLSTIKKIIHDHKGKIDIINKPNNSYVHTIIFPIA
jgi:signal transduction histidine kinase